MLTRAGRKLQQDQVRALIPGILAIIILLGAGITRPLLTWLRNLFGAEAISFLVGGAFLLGAIFLIKFIHPWRLAPGRRVALTAVAAAGLTYAFLFPAWPEERIHVLEYAILGWSARFLVRDAASSRLEALGVPLLFGFLIGGCDELLQFYLPERVGDLRDVAFNLAGTTWGIALNAICRGPRRR